MKKLHMVLTLAGVMVAANLFASFDGTITLNQNQYSYGSGGQFSAVTTGLGLGNFQSFCLENNAYFSPGSTYSYFQNTGAVVGGATGQTAIDNHTDNALSMDNISIGTAWLFSQFHAGSLANYFSGTVSVQKQHAGDLQNAIWYLEGEASLSSGTYFYNLAKQYAGAGGLTDTQVKADAGGAYGVVALNLYSQTYITGNRAVQINGQTWYASQDQLALVPEPTTIIAGALLLLPFGVSTLRILRRNRAIKS